MEVYSDVFAYAESDLDISFRDKFSDRLVPGSRGFGYWVWKPQIILQAFRRMAPGDLLHYADAGCRLNPKGAARLEEYFAVVSGERTGLLAFQVKNTFGDPILDGFSLPERRWTKGDLFDYFSARGNSFITDSEQIGAGNIFLRKCPAAEDFVRRWLKVFEDDFSLADDSPSISENFPDFIEHRHDQSVFGVLCKVHGVPTLSAFEYWYPSSSDISKPDWKKLEYYPVWAKRDLDMGAISKLKDLFRRARRRIEGRRGEGI